MTVTESLSLTYTITKRLSHTSYSKRFSDTFHFTFHGAMILLCTIFMKVHFILNSSEIICDKNLLSKIQSIKCGRLVINISEGQFDLTQSAVI